MTPYMPHYCGNASRIHGARRNYAAKGMRSPMQDRQRPIAEWMNEVMAKHGISSRAWAERAKLGKDTVSRAVREDYGHVTSTTTIAKLAEALDERPYGAAAGVPSAAALASILTVLHRTILGELSFDQGTIAALGAAMRDTLLHLADEPDALDDPKLSQAVARVSARPHIPSSAQSQKS